MKCLNFKEAHVWLRPEIKITANNALTLPRRGKEISCELPTKPLPLFYLSAELVKWFEMDHEILLWVQHYRGNFQMSMFDKLRVASGNKRSLSEAHGQTFNKFLQADVESAASLSFLVMAFSWEGYLVGDSCESSVYIGDEYLNFSCDNQEQLTNALEMINRFRMQIIRSSVALDT